MTAASVQISVTTVTAQGTHFITSSSAHKRLEITGPPLSQSLSEWSLPVRDSAYPQLTLWLCCLLVTRDGTVWHFAKMDYQKRLVANKDEPAIRQWEVTKLEVKSEAKLHGFREDRADRGALTSPRGCGYTAWGGEWRWSHWRKLGKQLIKHEDILGVGPARTFTLKETEEMPHDTESRQDKMLEADPSWGRTWQLVKASRILLPLSHITRRAVDKHCQSTRIFHKEKNTFILNASNVLKYSVLSKCFTCFLCPQICVYVYVYVLRCVQFFATPWTVAHQAPLSMGFSRQEYWSELPFSSPGKSSWPEDQT